MGVFRSLLFFALVALMIIGALGNDFKEFNDMVKKENIATLGKDGHRCVDAGKYDTAEWYARVLDTKNGGSIVAAAIRDKIPKDFDYFNNLTKELSVQRLSEDGNRALDNKRYETAEYYARVLDEKKDGAGAAAAIRAKIPK
ncbi:uncharacterized protein LOC116341701 [Contarinia nasturtii]|uniref:uncharacterized protein LOC116341701 n=1 Tax=Contarinia nasturtii TaxID=265458 RepID=UPI0012D49D60|nr:uncharacterized protein LOC116341701 [Contarinia nasturtii]